MSSFASQPQPPPRPSFQPSVETVKSLLASGAGNTIPVYQEVAADLLTPVSAYLKLTKHSTAHSFLFESVAGGEKIGRYSFIGSNPRKILRVGDKETIHGDPLLVVEKELADIKYVKVHGLQTFTGGAVGYIAYDCIRFFEPAAARPMKDTLELPDAIFMICDTIIVFDHLRHVLQVVSHFRTDTEDLHDLEIEAEYSRVVKEISAVVALLSDETTVLPKQRPITTLEAEAVSNVGKAGYESFVTRLKHHIVEGDIIQAVPSQRVSRRTDLHPFNAYRQLRGLNPSPYMFYVDCDTFQLVGASPEMLVKVEDGRVYTHPIAGTRRRGATPTLDDALAQELLGDLKERSEHVMLVDLGRNDVNRVCRPETVTVDSLMHIERYSHVMHIVSNVSGRLREGKSMYDAFRSIFPAGTVSGAPKVRAMQLVGEMEGDRRGVYAGAVGWFGYSGNLDTCIAIRTMLFKDGFVHLQAGGGIVYDSVPEDEFEETVNKLRSNVTAIQLAEKYHHSRQEQQTESLLQEQVLTQMHPSTF
ncbi:anthranilate synthase component I [Zopfochytrium polystomum]|nr:anthranilate synthase component I [Zopfochytrium polystomum]